MQTAAIAFDRFEPLRDEACQDRIVAAKAALGRRAVILGHHYQRADVYRHADLTGDSLKLSRLASQTDAEFIVFCGVHFMAEVADILSQPHQISILPDLSAGCSMADMANLAKVVRAWRELAAVLDPDEQVTPVTYINSAADLKAFCGEHGGIVCTSSNAAEDPRLVVRRAARRCCSFPISTWVAGAATRWASRSSRCRYGIPTSRWAVSRPSRSRRAQSCCGRGTARCTRCSSRSTS